MKTDIQKALEALDKGTIVPEPPVLKVESIPYTFSEKAQAALDQKKYTSNPCIEKFTFLACIAKTKEAVPKAVQALAEQVELLADKGLITGHLALPSSIPLVNNRIGVFIFLGTKGDFAPQFYLDLNQDLFVPEGSIGQVEFE